MDDSDQQPELVRLSKVAGECNVALYTIIEQLAAKGVKVEPNPNAKISYALYQELLRTFQHDKELRERSREAFERYKAEQLEPAITLNPSAMNAVWIFEKGPGKADALMLVHDAAEQEITAAGLASVLDENVEDRKRKEKNTEDHILLIDIFLAFKDPEYQHHQDLGGIALLKFLRIKEVNNHIVLLSPWNLQQLLRMDPGYHILASKGITIAQYTHSLDELRTHDGVELDTAKLAKEKAPPKEQLRDYFKAGISLPKDERHNWANWWGVYALVELQNAHHPKLPGKRWTLPEPVAKKLQVLRNAEVRYVYDDFKACGAPVLSPIESVNARIVYIDDQAKEGWEEVLRNCLDAGSQPSLWTYVPAPGLLKDQNGISAFLGNKPNGNDRALEKALQDCDMVLLDLRLDPSNDKEIGQANVDELSGIRLLKAIRERHPGMPVLMFTASTSAEVRERLLALGVDRTWMKPGVESSIHAHEYGLANLIDGMRRLAMPDYRGLRKLGEAVVKAWADQDYLWWKNWQFNGRNPWDMKALWTPLRSTDKLFLLLDSIIHSTRQLFKEFDVHEHPDERSVDTYRAYLISGVINRCGGVAEFLHFGDDASSGSAGVLWNEGGGRNDCLGWLLFQLRHNASHFTGSSRAQRRHLMLALACLAAYITKVRLPDTRVGGTTVQQDALFSKYKAFGMWRCTTWWRREPADVTHCDDYWGSELRKSIQAIVQKAMRNHIKPDSSELEKEGVKWDWVRQGVQSELAAQNGSERDIMDDALSYYGQLGLTL